ncbi:hypothetical protein JB92DRAFT_2834483 [Gautieria morchelliformis]|nr:hypothetical protein JB92DRAFT_2834483 [Gautieria morchelliformis]
MDSRIGRDAAIDSEDERSSAATGFLACVWPGNLRQVHAQRSTSLHIIAAALRSRFEASGRHEDLDAAIDSEDERSSATNGFLACVWVNNRSEGMRMPPMLRITRSASPLKHVPYSNRRGFSLGLHIHSYSIEGVFLWDYTSIHTFSSVQFSSQTGSWFWVMTQLQLSSCASSAHEPVLSQF